MTVSAPVAFNPLLAGFGLLFKRSPQPMLVVERGSWRLLDGNAALTPCLGFAPERLLDMRLPELFYPQDWTLAHDDLTDHLLVPEPPLLRWRMRGHTGSTIDVEVHCEDAMDKGVPVCLLLLRDVVADQQALDVTLWNRDLQRLQQECELLGAVVNSSSEAIISVDATGHIQTLNPGAERIFAVRSADLLGQSVDLLLPQRFRPAHALHRSAFANSELQGPRMMGLRVVKGLRSDGQELDLEGSIFHVTIDGHQVLIASLRDVSHQMALEQERQHTRNQLSRLTHRLMSQEKELVKRIAQALHDQLGQTVAAIRLIHETMGALRRGVQSADLEQLDGRLASLIDQAISQVRLVLVDLQPPMLDESGLAAALDNELRKRASTPTAMQLVLVAPPEVSRQRWPAAVEYAAFMIAREAVENAIRHSQATRLMLTLAGDASTLRLDIQDNGCGIQASPDAAPGHLGWASIKERANSIGAHVSLGPVSGGGTCVSLTWQERP